MAVLVQPPTMEKPLTGGPVIFLGGPIQGAPDWQRQAFDLLDKDGPESLVVANPRRDKLDPDFNYDEQVDWESKWLYKAGTGFGHGVILFWFAAQVEEHPERVYAQTSRFELGEWFGRAQFIGPQPYMPQIVVGLEEDVPGAKYIRKRLEHLAEHTHVAVCDSLEATCAAALERLHPLAEVEEGLT